MDYFDIYAAFTTAFLYETNNELYTALSEMAELQKLPGDGQICIGGRGKNGQPLPFVSWTNALREEGISRLQWVYQPNEEEFLLEVTTSKGHYLFKPDYVEQPLNKITGQQFVDLIDAQQQPAKIWEGLLNNHNKKLQRLGQPAVTQADLQAFLKDTDPYRYNIHSRIANKDRQLEDTWQEVQVLCILLQIPLQIPAAYKKLVLTPEQNIASPVEEQIHLFPLQTLSAAELLTLVNAQPFADEVWEELPKQLRYYPELPQLRKSAEAIEFITHLPEDALGGMANVLCGLILRGCRQRNTEPVIPSELAGKLGPDEAEKVRMHALAQVSAHYYELASNAHNWEVYFYEEVSKRDWVENMLYGPFEPTLIATDLNTAKADFEQALQQHWQLAQELNPRNRSLFDLARFFLNDDFPEGAFDKEYWKRIREQLEAAGFTSHFIRKATQAFSFSATAKPLPWSPAQRRYFCVCEILEEIEESAFVQARDTFKAAVLSMPPVHA
jgi:hypothetical protein